MCYIPITRKIIKLLRHKLTTTIKYQVWSCNFRYRFFPVLVLFHSLFLLFFTFCLMFSDWVSRNWQNHSVTGIQDLLPFSHKLAKNLNQHHSVGNIVETSQITRLESLIPNDLTRHQRLETQTVGSNWHYLPVHKTIFTRSVKRGCHNSINLALQEAQ